MSPLRIGLLFGLVAVAVAVVADLRFLLWDPLAMPDWILTSFETYRTSLALAAYLFLAILAAIRVRPAYLEPGVPYGQQLVRDGALAATVVAVVVGLALIVITLLTATVFADDARAYARDAAPSIYAYNEKVANRLSDPPEIPPTSEFERQLQPPEPRQVGQSLANLVLRGLLLGTAGALVGLLRSRNAREPEQTPQGGDLEPAAKEPGREPGRQSGLESGPSTPSDRPGEP